MNQIFLNTYKSKKVLVTGHTGFKGSWLTTWLISLGAFVVGYSKDIPTNPSMFDSLNLSKKIQHNIADIQDLNLLKEIINKEKPDFIFHMAAQAIVSTSFSNPVETIKTNAIGTMNLLEILRSVNFPCVVIFITSDKCYDNIEWIWGYRENDKLGGKDVYSGSKAAAEIIINSYVQSFFNDSDSSVRIGIARAGNVIGGGDWAKDRIIPDVIKSWMSKSIPEIRNPKSTRPWQHVLEPLSGYLLLAHQLSLNKYLHSEPFNFGPKSEQVHTVLDLIENLAQKWGFKNKQEIYRINNLSNFKESALLKLNCDKALFYLKWEPNLYFEETVSFLADWYINFHKKNIDMFEFTNKQITEYVKTAEVRKRIWAQN